MSKVYLCGINTALLPKISEKDSIKMLEEIASGDKEARERFILGNFRLVLSIMKRFNLKGESADDVFQAGSIGLIKAIDNFDCSFKVKFSTYAVPMIIGEIKKFLREKNSLRVARSIRDTAYQVLKTRTLLEKDGKEVSQSDIAKTMNLKEQEVAYCLDAISDTVSLYEPVYNKEGDELLLVDQIAGASDTDEKWTENFALSSLLSRLNKRERKIIYLRYYVGKTQTEISREVGISQAQVSRIEKGALSYIKQGLRC